MRCRLVGLNPRQPSPDQRRMRTFILALVAIATLSTRSNVILAVAFFLLACLQRHRISLRNGCMVAFGRVGAEVLAAGLHRGLVQRAPCQSSRLDYQGARSTPPKANRCGAKKRPQLAPGPSKGLHNAAIIAACFAGRMKQSVRNGQRGIAEQGPPRPLQSS